MIQEYSNENKDGGGVSGEFLYIIIIVDRSYKKYEQC
jgi:hypothetical protein